MLLIDHNMALIMDVCDRIQVLDQGRLLAEGTPAEIRENLDVAAAYLGESAVIDDGRDGMTPSAAHSRSTGSSVRYGGVSAVRDVSLEVRQGEIVGLIGPNGAGQVDDAPRDHGRRPDPRGRHPARRALAPRPRRPRRSPAPASRSSRRAGGSSAS